MTTAVTDSFEIYFTGPDEVTKIYEVEELEDLKIKNLSPADLIPKEQRVIQANWPDLEDSVTGEETNVEFIITTKNPIPAGGAIQIRLPKWNNNRESYIDPAKSKCEKSD